MLEHLDLIILKSEIHQKNNKERISISGSCRSTHLRVTLNLHLFLLMLSRNIFLHRVACVNQHTVCIEEVYNLESEYQFDNFNYEFICLSYWSLTFLKICNHQKFSTLHF